MLKAIVHQRQSEYVASILRQETRIEWGGISSHPSITWDIIQQNPDKPWNWRGISQNPNITWNIIQQNPDKPWDWRGISRNPNISWEIIQQNPDKPWSWFCSSYNKALFKLPQAKIVECIRQHIAAKSIARHWKVCNSNPEYLVCRKRLLHEFKSLLILI